MRTLLWISMFCLLAMPGAALTLDSQAGPAATSRAGIEAPVNINTATVADLETLPGIGRRTAERIVEYRQKAGGFKKIEELMNVRGIGEKSFLRLKPLVTVAAAKGEKPPAR